jgi:hypothetical protein
MWKLIAVVVIMTISLSGAVKIEKTQYRGWPNCYRISNGEVELIVTTDVGPRIIRYSFVGGQNLFKEFNEQMGKHGESSWRARGGHRLWMSPEDPVLTYAPDNSSIRAEVKGEVLELTGNVEKETGLEKQIIVKLAGTGSAVDVVHKITNKGNKGRKFAVWALTMMAQGGVGIASIPPRGTHEKDLAPTNPLVMWAYTDFSDRRWQFTSKYLMLRQDPKNSNSQKAGLFNRETVGAYLLGSDLFIKRATAHQAARHPDFGCSYETFTNEQFLEMETLGELSDVRPGASLEHAEHWSLHKNIKIPSWTDADIDRALVPLLQR